MDATDCAIDGTVIWASRAEGLVARAGAPAWTTGIGRGASGRTGAGADAGLVETALAAAAALVFAGADLAGAVGVLTGNGFFAAGLAAVFAALAAGLVAGLAFAAGFVVFFAGTLAAGFFAVGLALAAGFAGALAVFFAGAGLALAAVFVLAAALVWGFKSCLLATALA